MFRLWNNWQLFGGRVDDGNIAIAARIFGANPSTACQHNGRACARYTNLRKITGPLYRTAIYTVSFVFIPDAAITSPRKVPPSSCLSLFPLRYDYTRVLDVCVRFELPGEGITQQFRIVTVINFDNASLIYAYVVWDCTFVFLSLLFFLTCKTCRGFDGMWEEKNLDSKTRCTNAGNRCRIQDFILNLQRFQSFGI